jgi:carbonic anhydrase
VEHGSFVTVINCMDGRVQEPVIAWMKDTYGVQYVDSITEPGPICMFEGNSDPAPVASIRDRVDISVKKHGSHVVAVVAHHDCAGNPVGKDKQLCQLAAAVEAIRSWGFAVDVIGLWVDESWQVRPAT